MKKWILFFITIALFSSFMYSRYFSCSNKFVHLFEELQVAEGFNYEVVARHLKQVSNLAKTSDGELYATLELKYPDGKLVHLSQEGKERSILNKLNRPDGLRIKGNKLYIVEEVQDGRIIEYNLHTSSFKALVTLSHLEGLAIVSDEELLVTEDKHGGRLLKVTLSGDIITIADGLLRPEGIAIGKQGEIYIAETGSGNVLVYKNGQLHSFINGLNEPDQLAVDNNGALWIAEDAKPGRLLRYQNNALETIVDCLCSPQGILIDGTDILVAEQGLNRIIRISRVIN